MMPGGFRIMLCVTPMDMRASFDGLALAVKERLAIDAKAERAMFVFLNKRRDMMKMLWRDATGWCLFWRSGSSADWLNCRRASSRAPRVTSSTEKRCRR